MGITNNKYVGTPPKLFASFIEGFNTVASHIQLLLFPIVIDLLIWLGPKIRIKSLLEPEVVNFTNSLLNLDASEMAELAEFGKESWMMFLERFNIFSMIRTLPIGIPSLMAGNPGLENPMGPSAFIEISSYSSLILIWLLLIVVGIFFGCLFFSEIARISINGSNTFSIKSVFKQLVQIVLLTITFIVLMFLILIPVMILITVVSMINLSLVQIAIVIISVVLLWALLPLVFSPHGIFSYEQNFLVAILSSMRMVRFFLPGAGMFLLTAILLNQGMDILWNSAPQSSWFALLGIFGHAFIATSVITASFIYYKQGITWVNENIRYFAKSSSNKIKPSSF